MKNGKIISSYMDIEVYRKSFNELAKNTFGLNFEEWYQNGYLGDKYIAYSYLQDDKIIANVSVNKMNLVMDGKIKKAIQIGTVMTDSKYRNMGLAAKLMNHVIQKYENSCDLIYLFANDSVLEFYPKFGFEKISENSYEMEAKDIKRKVVPIKRLDIKNENDRENIKRLVQNRKPISEKLGIINDQWPLLVYCLYEYRNDMYYLMEDDSIVIARRNDHTLHLYDIISQKPINLDDVLEKVVREEDERVQFYFIPKKSKYNVMRGVAERIDDTLFVRTKDPLCDEILFPMTSHT
ncbi:GNAT family N-acetyltransferase [Anaeromicrobium sediminis]|uniref:N-acetyltransferase domain-containing protein n=1 Tax=Anaeromicrobium sediminis TaxID=1478221 RepID=A0A267MN64_9FIRM|nr:GNAT family N-acetyltransferase [Anaeromicrobium sediminis]PAB60358.1 hypothetical protein CCE28_05535 [Anaeromicrobium sediminis]